MALRSFSVERYRSFAAPTHIELRPLTLLYGYNSAGKSALLRGLPLLAASAGGADIGPLALDADVARRATYADLRCRLADRNRMTFTLAWDDAGAIVREVELTFREDEGEKQHILEQVIARDDRGAELLRVVDVPGEPGNYEAPLADGTTATLSLELSGIRVMPPFGPHVSAELHEALRATSERLGSLQSSVHWLGAVRAPIERGDTPYRGIPARLGDDGRHAPQRLAFDERGKRKVFDAVARVVQKMFNHRLCVRENGPSFALELEAVDGLPIRVSIVDTGEGLTQVLPVLTLGAMALEGDIAEGAVLAIEQPEMHLHPRAERELASFFCQVARAPSRPRLLVETHSENLLLFTQLAVAKQEIRPEDVAILWVEMDNGGRSTVRHVPLDEHGRPQNWPMGVFSEDVELARELFLARRGARP